MQTVQKHLSEYAQRNFIETEKQAQLLEQLLQDYPFLDTLFIQNRENSSINHVCMHCVKENHTNIIDIHTSDMTLTNEQEYVFDNILHTHVGLHLLIGTHGSGKTCFVKYLAQHCQLSQKYVLMCATTGATTLQLSPTASTAHTLFRILSWGYLSPLQEPSTVLERLCFSPRNNGLSIVSKLLGFP